MHLQILTYLTKTGGRQTTSQIFTLHHAILEYMNQTLITYWVWVVFTCTSRIVSIGLAFKLFCLHRHKRKYCDIVTRETCMIAALNYGENTMDVLVSGYLLNHSYGDRKQLV